MTKTLPGFKIIKFKARRIAPPKVRLLTDVLNGKSEFEYLLSIIKRLESGDLMDVITLQAQADLFAWLEGNDLMNGDPFAIIFNFADGERNAALHCDLKLDFSGDEPKIALIKSTPGMSDMPPKDLSAKRFEFFLCDLDFV